MATHTGRCLCHAVVYEGRGEPHMHVCHCSDCRRWAGGPSFNVTFADGIDIADPGTVNWFQSSDWAERGSCRACGSTLFYRMLDGSAINVSAGSLDDASSIGAIEEHIFIDSKPDYYDFTADAPRVTGAEVFARFSGSEDQT